jgi:hypothetical protein
MRPGLLAALSLALLGATLLPPQRATAAGAAASSRPRVQPVRAAEDWRPLADPARRTAPLDGLKCLDLGGGRRLTLGAELRLLHESFRDEDWGLGSQRDGGSWLLRGLAHADVRGRDRWRLFVQLGTGQERGRPGGPRPLDRSDLYANAAFIETTIRPAAGQRLQLRAGRMELSYAWGRLISFRGRPTLKRSHDGFRVRWQQRRAWTDLFLTWDVERAAGVLGSRRRDDRRLLGAYHSRSLARGQTLDLYVLATDRPDEAYFLDAASPAPTAGAEERWSLGARWEGRWERLSHDTEVTWQTGRFQAPGGPDLDIAAWAVGTRTRLHWPAARGAELGLDLAYSSGDADSEDGRLGTFRAPAAGAAFLGGGHLLSYGNLGLVHLLGAMDLADGLRLQLGAFWFWRPRVTDGTYALPGRPLLPPAPGRDLGVMPELILTWRAAPYTTLRLEVDRSPAAEYQREVTPGQDTLFVSSELVFIF